MIYVQQNRSNRLQEYLSFASRALEDYRYFTTDDSYAVLTMKTVSINYWNLIKLIAATFKKVLIMLFRLK
jgi:hypothetical protein